VTNKKENWVQITGYKGHYEVSSNLRIRSLDRIVNNSAYGEKRVKGVILKPANNPQGYPCVSLALNGIARTIPVHRIIAIAFIPNPENKKCVNHKNGIKTDYRIENLEWTTYSENIQHAYDFLGRTSNKPTGKDSKYSKKVKCDTLDIYFDSVRETQEALGVGNVADVCRSERRHCNGLVFRYV
jgi:NUMOD4 motif/HNH endonuclease